MVRLVVAIGNPGESYLKTRHNIGFLLADALLKDFGENFKRTTRLLSYMAKIVLQSGEEVIFIKPTTYVNLSGDAAHLARSYYKVSLNNVLVLADDVNKPFGDLRLRLSAGSGGHNGIKSITKRFKSSDYWQLRIGVGRPEGNKLDLSDYVLGSFSQGEEAALDEIFINARGLIMDWCSQTPPGLEKTLS